MISGPWAWLKDKMDGSFTDAKSVGVRALAGATILFLAGVIYLGTYVTEVVSCLGSIAREVIGQASVNRQCLVDVFDDLRDDGTAATVILAIAAAVLASAWSSGSRSAE